MIYVFQFDTDIKCDNVGIFNEIFCVMIPTFNVTMLEFSKCDDTDIQCDNVGIFNVCDDTEIKCDIFGIFKMW
mgnify:CR=1 FL=1